MSIVLLVLAPVCIVLINWCDAAIEHCRRMELEENKVKWATSIREQQALDARNRHERAVGELRSAAGPSPARHNGERANPPVAPASLVHPKAFEHAAVLSVPAEAVPNPSVEDLVSSDVFVADQDEHEPVE